jgi:hypothetical protein
LFGSLGPIFTFPPREVEAERLRSGSRGKRDCLLAGQTQKVVEVKISGGGRHGNNTVNHIGLKKVRFFMHKPKLNLFFEKNLEGCREKYSRKWYLIL